MGIELITMVASVMAAVLAAWSTVACVRLRRAHMEHREERERSIAEREQMHETLTAAGSALSQVSAAVNAALDGLSSLSIIEQQHFEAQSRAFDQMGVRVDDVRRETTQYLEKTRETVDAQLGAMRSDNERKLEAIRVTGGREARHDPQ